MVRTTSVFGICSLFLLVFFHFTTQAQDFQLVYEGDDSSHHIQTDETETIRLDNENEVDDNSAKVINVSNNSFIDIDERMLPPILIINLDRAKARWEKVSTTMRSAGLTDREFSRLSAVDGRTLSFAELQNQSTKLAMFLQPRGVIGCYLSHRKFWQYVVDEHLDRAIVLEDDIHLVDDFKEKLIESMRNIDPEDTFDVLFLGAIGMLNLRVCSDNYQSL